ncbi:hypothetical protein AAFF_G00006050 [Aldrovandia affinis]|uniref:Uncharacterized protein n=1 Tax=Aldrovandia affinis TaxID=143900 RepID=A0AAD7TFX9_9TELE|nr:hypothetical protein AAFF_G00006050 [Aldrovandia affinis]
MGNSPCNPSPDTVNELFSIAQSRGIVPDAGLDGTLGTFLSLNSSVALSHQYADIQRSLSPERLTSYNHDLATTFGDGAQIAFGGVGIVALALSLLLEVLAHHTLSDPIQRIFGADHSSDIGTLVSEYLKQVPKVANEPQKMAEVTERYDRALAHELIDFYEVMTVDRRMSSASIKQWLNGAAFHLHLRIHQVRMGAYKKGYAESLGISYKAGFPVLIKTYTEYLQRHVRERPPGPLPGLLIIEPFRNMTHQVHHRPCESDAIANRIASKVLEAQGIQRSMDFFEETEKHMDSLISQQGNFSLQANVSKSM